MATVLSPGFNPQNNLSATIGNLKMLLTIVFITVGQHAFSQLMPENTLNINSTYIPASGYNHSKNFEDTKLKTAQQSTNLGYSFPISAKKDSLTGMVSSWTGSLSGAYSRLDHKDDVNNLIPSRLLSSNLGITHFRSINASWSMLSTLSAGINADLEKVSSHDLFINGAFLFIKTYSPTFSIGFGGFVYNAINSPLVLPAFILQWQTTGKFRLNIDFPSEISVAYHTSEKTELKLAFRPKNISYDVENKVDPKKTLLNYWELPVGLENKWKGKRIDFMLSAGVTTLRSFQFGERGIKNIYQTPPAHLLKPNVFVNAGISYRLNK
ncbi:DUF6268 family outer membrane beta-barrel protein [Pedobacter hartonius]|uniref:DUF6268 domain-containing protein n=1 Tax=Pedobacter hartonius TaxID=425514 RepID=A0A1H4HKQ5_9SPHI|nr:DUF6268 family outer membrane beta-barrel protein [Pedobacter hartonius]SEB22030.1 hypothetical protein SAMN05443550_1257 [Pedobacter hartonius]